MEMLVLILVGLGASVLAHMLSLRRLYSVLVVLIVLTGGLYAAIHWYVGTLEGWDGLTLAIFALIAVMPFGGGLVLGGLTGWLHLRWKAGRNS
ncbi:hypothetical protein FEE96_04675 [Parasedimentitalea maritima]|uniref:Uncharacterized protein n=1 Tax=Parasedimentitalea maritima TaxID=2578117 RepID=A0ABY2V0R5_9RHOB|nr:hypothetical protein [Zongyanglinia marina]TLP67829.1 hypothetical protein FEE96_04675 [Zongyanglinia marina]